MAHGSTAAVALLAAALPLVWAQAGERDVYVSVFDKSGSPVTGLVELHFAVREDGQDRAVVRVGPFTGPSHIALLVDTSSFVDSAVEPYRSGLASFVRKMAPGNQVALYEFGDRANRLVAFTGEAALLEDAVGHLGVRANAVPRLLDAIDLACRDLRAAEARRPVIVAVSIASADSSTATGGAIVKRLIAESVSLHVVTVAQRSALASPSLTTAAGRSEIGRLERLGQVSSVGEGERERTQVLKEGPAKTAGALHEVTSTIAIGPALDRVYADLRSAYRLTYARGGAGRSRNLQIGLMLQDVVVRAIPAPGGAK